MRYVGVLEAKTQLSALLDAVEKDGEQVVITRHGKPIARLMPEVATPAGAQPLSGAEILLRAQALWSAQPADPEFDGVTWEEMKDIARS